MSMSSGAIAVRRFVSHEGAPPQTSIELCDLLKRHALSGPLMYSGVHERAGWVRQDNLFDTDFNPADCHQAPYLLWAFRLDKKEMPPEILKAMIEVRCREMMTMHNIRGVPAHLRQEIREDVLEENLQDVLPKVKRIDVAWNLQTGVFYVFSTSNAVVESVIRLMALTFDLIFTELGSGYLSGYQHEERHPALSKLEPITWED